jgi:hypothetical protein
MPRGSPSRVIALHGTEPRLPCPGRLRARSLPAVPVSGCQQRYTRIRSPATRQPGWSNPSSAFVVPVADPLASKHFAQGPLIRWTRRDAHLLLQIRTVVMWQSVTMMLR